MYNSLWGHYVAKVPEDNRPSLYLSLWWFHISNSKCNCSCHSTTTRNLVFQKLCFCQGWLQRKIQYVCWVSGREETEQDTSIREHHTMIRPVSHICFIKWSTLKTLSHRQTGKEPFIYNLCTLFYHSEFQRSSSFGDLKHFRKHHLILTTI